VNQLDAEMAAMAREYVRGVIPEGAYRTATGEMLAERAAAQEALDEAAAQAAPKVPSQRRAADLLVRWPMLSVASRNAVLRDLVVVVVEPGEWRSQVRVMLALDWSAQARTDGAV
jgi:hypothetical protein